MIQLEIVCCLLFVVAGAIMVLSIEALKDDEGTASFFLGILAIFCMTIGLVVFDKTIDKAIQEQCNISNYYENEHK